jgi:hypothetical protein
MKKHLFAAALASAVLSPVASAAPYAPFDVRAAGMGGTGVASAKTASAALFNPAMLSAQVEGDRFQFLLGAGATVADEDGMFDQFDELQATIDSMDQLINTDLSGLTLIVGVGYHPGTTQHSVLNQVYSTTTRLVGQMNEVNNDNLIAGLGSGIGLGVASKKFGFGLFATATGNAIVTPQVSAADTSRLANYVSVIAPDPVTQQIGITAAEIAGNSEFLNLLVGSGGNPSTVTLDDFDPQSSANGMAVALGEFGLSFSHEFAMGDGGALSVGITPKAVQVVTYDYTANLDTFEDSDIDTLEKTEDVFDVDLGLVYKPSSSSAWQAGLVAKHLVGGEFDTLPNAASGALPQTVELATQVRAGIARMTNRTTLALDIDLAENEGVRAGSATQFLAFGAEYDLKFLQLRAGYRANLADSDVSDVATLGLGLGPVDISAMASEQTVGGYLQLGFGW